MAISMTGFGRAEYKTEQYSFTVEAKTINHRYFDVSIKLPRRLIFLEDPIRKYIKGEIQRGKIELFIKMDAEKSSEETVTLDKNLAFDYINILKTLNEMLSSEQEIKAMDVARFPDVIKSSDHKEDEAEIETTLMTAVKICIEQLKSMKETEGIELAKDIIQRTQILDDNIKVVEKLSENVESEYRTKIKNKLEEILKESGYEPDPQRIIQEAAIYADKNSITEEIVRFKAHIMQLRDTLNSNGAIGRKLDFLLQEMNREINTIGSKASSIEITTIVVDLKSEMEKIREQIQNIE